MIPKKPCTRQQSKYKGKHLGLVFLLGCIGLLCAWPIGCGVGPECSKDTDCGGTQVCTASVCVPKPVGETSTQEVNQSEDTKTENTTPETSLDMAGDAADQGPPPEDDIPPDNPPEGDIDPGTCVDGHTRPCYSGPAGTQDQGNCTAGTQTCQAGVWDPVCVGEVLPSQEICDGKDNDCDGQTDNNFSGQGASCQVPGKQGPCLQGIIECQSGAPVCVASYQPLPEDCSNQIDDDCDGLVDGPPCKCNAGEVRECYTGHPPTTASIGECLKGKQTCDSGGKWGKCEGEVTPQAEICDGKDNDCDGQLDEDFPEKGQSCTDTTQQGECQRGVYTTCTNGLLICTSTVKATQEVCGNGKDDDCNGKIDDNPPCQCKPGQKRSCYSGAPGTDQVLPCKRGTQTCDTSGQWGTCTDEVTPKAETCDNTDEDCDGTIDKMQRTCSTACGKGTEICKSGKWGSCTAQQPIAERCDGKDNDCNGQIDENLSQSCSNICGKGTETCSAGKWVNCTAPKAGTEICDGKDNDCDGQTDEGNPGGGAACSIRGALGECAKGTITCTNAKLDCKANQKAQTEVCDGLDNDCDGKVDESDPSLNKACTITGNKGECRTGAYACANNKLYCKQTVFSVTELCRDGKDNDCDGLVDEICGNSYTYANINSSGTLRTKRGISTATRTATGTYQITASSSLYGCDKRPMFISPSSSSMRPTSYDCTGSKFDVRIGGHAPRTTPVPLFDWGHSVVVPTPVPGAAYGVYSCTIVSITPFKLACSLSRDYGGPKVTQNGTGIYDIDFAGCNSATQPVFASIYSSAPTGYAVAYYLSSGKCRVRTYDLNGNLANRYFSFWIPNRTQAAYAIISSNGSVYASNDFGDTKAKWTSQAINDSQGKFVRFETKFPAWNSDTAIFANPRIGAGYHTAVVSTSGGANVYSRTIPNATYTATYFSILFVQ